MSIVFVAAFVLAGTVNDGPHRGTGRVTANPAREQAVAEHALYLVAKPDEPPRGTALLEPQPP